MLVKWNIAGQMMTKKLVLTAIWWIMFFSFRKLRKIEVMKKSRGDSQEYFGVHRWGFSAYYKGISGYCKELVGTREFHKGLVSITEEILGIAGVLVGITTKSKSIVEHIKLKPTVHFTQTLFKLIITSIVRC